MSLPVGLNGDAVNVAVPPFSVTLTVYVDALKIKVNGTPVITSVTTTFTSAGPVPPPGTTEVVTVTPGATKLKDNGTNLLRLGDSNSGPFGNTVTVTPTQTKLRTA